MAARQYKSTTEVQQLDATINDVVGQIVLTNNSTFHPATLPSPPYTLVLDPDTSKEEIVTVTSKVSDSVLNVTRGEDGTGKIDHSAGAVVKHMVTARDLQEPQNHIYATSAVHGLDTGVAIVGDTKPQTLTNKTMTGTANTFSAIPQSAIASLTTDLGLKAPLAAPTFTGTVVLPSTTSIGTVSATEIGYIDGVTSSVQTQLDAKTTALAAHEADTTAIHGIADTSKLPNIASASAGRTVFVQAATPTALATGDIWFQVTGL